MILGAKIIPRTIATTHTDAIADTSAITGSLFSFLSSVTFILNRQIEIPACTQYVEIESYNSCEIGTI